MLLLTGSGSGAMEAAVVNTLSPGDRVLAVIIGGFGDRFADIADAFGANVDRMQVEWGEAADPAALAERLATDEPYRAVLLTHNETSTGVANPLRELVAAVHAAPGDPLTLVDGISGLGAMPFEMDAWGVDLVVSASQKAWMASPGIAIAAVGERARAAEAGARMPRFYWDFAEARKWASKGQTPWTPAVAVLYGLQVGVRRLLDEGRERTWARHQAIAAGSQAGLEGLGLRLVARPRGSVRHRHRRLAAGGPRLGAVQRRHARTRPGGGRGPGQVGGPHHALRAHGHGRDRRDGRRGAGHGRDARRPRLRSPMSTAAVAATQAAYDASRAAAAR